MLHWKSKITYVISAALVALGAVCGIGWTWGP